MEVQVDPKIEEFTRAQHKLLIDGEWVEAASGKTFETINQPDYDFRQPGAFSETHL